MISWHTAPNSGSRLTGDTSQGSIREAHNQLHPASRRVQPSATRGGRHNTSFPGRGADYGHRRWEGDFGGAGRGGDYRRAGEGGDYGAAGRGMTRPADRDSGRDGERAAFSACEYLCIYVFAHVVLSHIFPAVPMAH